MRTFAMALGSFQARLLLSLFYLTVLVPFAFMAKIKQPRPKGWTKRPGENVELARARLQF
jgi:hypothetical protein